MNKNINIIKRQYVNSFGKDKNKCRFCSSFKIILKYNLLLCRKCIRDYGYSIGLDKIN